jgi:hypothetical protein
VAREGPGDHAGNDAGCQLHWAIIAARSANVYLVPMVEDDPAGRLDAAPPHGSDEQLTGFQSGASDHSGM